MLGTTELGATHLLGALFAYLGVRLVAEHAG
jgi:hypothetical protein